MLFYYSSAQWVSLCKLSGPVGPTGLQGFQGPTGVQGITGVAGVTGAIGIAGVTGATGNNGATGAQGLQGITGVTGPLGTAGGDLGGSYPNPAVVALQGHAVSNTGPAQNNLLVWSGTAWTPTDGNGLFWKINGNGGTNPPTNFIGTTDPQALVFSTNSVEGMRITATGNVRIGSTSFTNQCGGVVTAEDTRMRLSSVGGFVSFGSYNNDPAFSMSPPTTSWIDGVGSLVVGMNRSGGTSNVDLWNNSDPANGAAALGNNNRGFNFRNFQSNGGCAENLLATLDGNGDLTLSRYAAGGGTANAYAFNTISDKRVKQNIQKFQEPVLDKIMKLNPVTYNYSIINYEPGHKLEIKKEAFPDRQSGFLAQEVYQLFPDAVRKPEDETKDLWAIDYSKLTVALTKAMQEQQQMIMEQKEEIELLKTEIEKLKRIR